MKDIDTKDDTEFEFNDDDNLPAAMLPDPVTKLTGNLSCAALTVKANSVQRLLMPLKQVQLSHELMLQLQG